MKKRYIAAIVALIGGFSIAPAQTWTPVTPTGVLYTAPSTTKIGIGTSAPTSLFHITNGDLKIGLNAGAFSTSNRLLFGDGDFIQIGELFQDDRLALQAKQFTFWPYPGYSGGIGIGIKDLGDEKLNVNGKTIIGGDLLAKSSLSVTGAALMNSSLVVKGTAITNQISSDDALINKNLIVNGAASINNAILLGTLMFGGTSKSIINSDGTICIGCTDSKGYKLGVNGSVAAKSVDVRVDLWSDYVFDKDFKLKSLDEVEKHIAQYKHLPDVPSEADMKANGLNVAKMDAVLLQKIEENTLYIIDLQKQNNLAKQQLSALEQQNEMLKEQIAILKQLVQASSK